MKNALLLFFLMIGINSLSLATDEEDFMPDPVNVSLGDKILDVILSSNALIKQGIAELTYQRCLRFLTLPGKILDKFYVYGKGHVSLNPTLACNKSSIDVIKALDFY